MNGTPERPIRDHRRLHRIALIAIAVLAAGTTTLAFAQIMQQRVIFPNGVDMVTLKGVLLGPVDDTRDFLVNVKAGQTLSVTMATEQTETTYFNVLPPGSTRALYRGEAEGKASWESQVKLDGEYRVRVFLNRAASRKRASSSFELTISVL